jgi:hypothetical protein
MQKLLYPLVLLLFSVPCLCQGRNSVPAREHPYYASNMVPALNELVKDRGRSKTNHFYVGHVQVSENGYHSVVVYWKENVALVLWEPGRGFGPSGDPDPRYDLRDTRRYWDLKKDVVPALSDVAGSSFLLAKNDALKMVDDCIRKGERYVLNLKEQSNALGADSPGAGFFVKLRG